MATAFAIPNDLSLKRYFFRSVFFHVLLTAGLLAGSYFERQGALWGGPGSQQAQGSTKVSLVSPAGIPMPKEEMVTDSRTVDPTKSLHKEDPKPPPPEPKTDATKIPKFEKEKPLPPSRPSRTLVKKAPEPDNAIPGRGGSPNLPTGYSQTPGASSSGVSAVGQGGADFAGRYPWYVDAVRNRVQQSWDQTTIDPAARAAHQAHSVMTFRINSNGSISHIRLLQSSGNSSMDYSAMRALQSIDVFRPLPNDYMGTYVDVTFDFDLSMMQ
jgi:periplasmic protein TonB